MNLLFPASPVVTIPVVGETKLFPVHRVYCVGRNYNDHVKEMGGVVGRDPPFFFSKPADAIVTDGKCPYPGRTTNLHHELELVVALGEGGRIFGHATGIDMTRRDLQNDAKELRRPWDTSKGFDFSGPVSAIVRADKPLTKGMMTLDVNGERRQTGDVDQMIWSVAEIIAELKDYFELKAGDVIFTGTPAGVGAVKRGDRMLARIEGLPDLAVEVT